MSRVTIFSTGTCPMCLLKKWGIAYDEQRVDQDQAALKQMSIITNGARTVPQIVIDDKWIGSFMELTELHMDGELDKLIEDGKSA